MKINKIVDLLYELQKSNINVLLDEDQLQIKIAKGNKVDSRLLEDIKVHKEGIIDYLRNKFPASKPGNSSMFSQAAGKRIKSSFVPLSFSQERLWIIDRVEGSIPYHIPVVLRFTGLLNKEAVEFAIRAIVNRHEVLRTVIEDKEGVPYQRVLDRDGLKLERIDGSIYDGDREALQKAINALILQPFDLSSDHMLRAHLIRLGEQQCILVMTLHHIASDAWSMPILLGELVELYTSYTEKRPVRLEPLALQYTDYAVWQRKELDGKLLAGKLSYWQRKLENVKPLDLPTDYPRPAFPGKEGGRVHRQIDQSVTGALLSLSSDEGVTLYMILLSVLNVLLYRYVGQKDICIGSSIAGRQQQELERMIGFFANTLALRNEVRSGMSFRDLLAQVKNTTLEGYEHQEVPFERVLEALEVEREAGRGNPLFQVMLVLENTPLGEKIDAGNIRMQADDPGFITAKFDITVTIFQSSAGLELNLTYRRELYREDTMQRMLGHYVNLLTGILKGRDTLVENLPMLDKTEEYELLHGFNSSRVEYPVDKTVVDLFAGQAARTPGEIAVVFENKYLTYKELDEQSDQLGHYLREQGVGAESLVGICMHRSLDMILGILGIMKAGAAYVPVDPENPEDRIKHVLEDIAPPVIVTNGEQAERMKSLAAGINAGIAIRIVNLNEDSYTQGPVRGSCRCFGLHANSLAYVIYTSGTTGTSKGVMIEHRSVVDYVHGLDARTRMRNCKSFALVSTLSADLGNTVIYGALLTGGTLHVLSKEAISDGGRMADYFERHEVDCLKIVPSHWKALSREQFLLPRKLLIFGGEVLPAGTVADILSSGATCTVVNHYGPTETTIGKLLYIVKPEDKHRSNIPLGRPFSNTRIYVLNRDQGLCPMGIPGELYIGGAGLARGYLNRPELTVGKFIVNPFQEDPNTRLYKTGDQVRWLPDGNIGFLGRVDDQVKIRGYRVELEEIGNVLLQSGLVQEVVVLLRDDARDNKRLVGYVVAKEGADPKEELDREKITGYLRSRLPEYMIPSLWIQMGHIPLTANGKVDKRALPDPESGEELQNAYAAPRCETERVLTVIWQELLGVEQVGINDNFFTLGGHSLLAIRLISAARKELGIEIPIGDIFDYPTIALLAGRPAVPADRAALPSLTQQDRPERIPLSFSQERLWFLDQLEGSRAYHIPVVLRLRGHLVTDALEYALLGIIERHEVLRTVIALQEGSPYQQVRSAGEWALERIAAGESWENTEVLRKCIMELIDHPFDLSRDYNLRAHLLRLSEQEHILVVTLHHIASDGWSNEILVREFVSLYEGYRLGKTGSLPALSVQYADYAIWQRQHLSGQLLEKKLKYWQDRLAGIKPLKLPTDYARPPVLSPLGARWPFRIKKETLEGIQALCRQEAATLFMGLLAAFQVLLHRYSGQKDISIGTVIAGRQWRETEGLIGFFVNTLVLRINPGRDMGYRELLRQVKVRTLEAYEHQEVPFEKVVEALVSERDMSRNPLFQVMFDLQNNVRPVADENSLGDLVLVPEVLQNKTSKFDLSFSVAEGPDGLMGNIEYRTDLYKEETIAGMANHYAVLLQSIIQGPELNIGSLEILGTDESPRLPEEIDDMASGEDGLFDFELDGTEQK